VRAAGWLVKVFEHRCVPETQNLTNQDPSWIRERAEREKAARPSKGKTLVRTLVHFCFLVVF
jgi:hypothetical protein